ncbi:MAG: SoxR reducing system RseC family protein [Desulfobacteraceae bacterium]|nr:SoxR reducing system RseC family protein [Desulfobacteraceae bacterium]MBC2754273.1 SoxR reducing system RseC family protein [Desulfobacteraceae bacterium]
MATEEGIIIKVNQTTAMVKTKQMTACESCAEKDTCHSTGESSKIMEVEAKNPVNAQVGDIVVVSFETSQLFMLSFLLYVFPIIVMIFGALLGERMAENFNGNPSTYSAVMGFSFFFIAMAIVKLKDKKARKTGQYRPEIIKVKKKARSGNVGNAEFDSPAAPCKVGEELRSHP